MYSNDIIRAKILTRVKKKQKKKKKKSSKRTMSYKYMHFFSYIEQRIERKDKTV